MSDILHGEDPKKIEAIKELMDNAINLYDEQMADKIYGMSDLVLKPGDKPVANIQETSEVWWKNSMDKAAKAAGAGGPQYIVSNAETAKAYYDLVNQEKDSYYSKYAAKIAEELNFAKENWPLFTELEPAILEIIKMDSEISLKDAYEKAYVLHSGKKLTFKGQKFDMPLHYVPMSSSDSTIGSITTSNEVPFKKVAVAKAKSKYPAFTPVTKAAHVEAPKPAIPMWTLTEAADVVKVLQPQAQALGYHVCLGGGTVNNGMSTKDVDLYFLPMGGKIKGDPGKLLVHLSKVFENKPEIIGKHLKYPATTLPYVAKVTYWWWVYPDKQVPQDLCSCASCQKEFKEKQKARIKKRLDVFVMGDKLFDVEKCVEEECFEMIELTLAQDNILHEGKKK